MRKINNNIFIKTNFWLFERGVREVANLYFITKHKYLCVLDVRSFKSKIELVYYLRVIKEIKAELIVLLVGDDCYKRNILWYLERKAPLSSWRDTIEEMNVMGGNIDDLVEFYISEVEGDRL